MAHPRTRDPVRHALRYPFPAPEGSYRLTRTGPAPLDGAALPGTDAGGRTCVLAVGANAAPEVLAGKLTGRLGTDGVPVLRALARDLVAVYSAHFTAYGAVPATPILHTGAVAQVFVLLLDAAQLAALDGTEAIGVNYRRERLMELDLRLDGGGRLTACDAYVSLHGPLRLDGTPVALKAVAQAGVPWPRLSQVRVQDAVRRRLGVEATLAGFVRGNVADAGLRARRTAGLKAAD